MTRKTFYKKLREAVASGEYTPRRGQYTPSIRFNGPDSDPLAAFGDHCPITAVCRYVTGDYWPIFAFEDAAAALGLDPEFAVQVADSADGYKGDNHYNGAVRAALVRAERGA